MNALPDAAHTQPFQLRIDGGEDPVGLDTTTKTDECMSPPWMCEVADRALDGIDIDLCSHPQSIVPAKRRVLLPEDGLLVPTPDLKVYTNCPFSTPLPWAKRFGEARAELFLIRIDTTTRWWSLLWDKSKICVLLDRRIAFGLVGDDGHVTWGNAAKWSCALFGAGAVRADVLAEQGYVAKRDPSLKRALRTAKRRRSAKSEVA